MEEDSVNTFVFNYSDEYSNDESNDFNEEYDESNGSDDEYNDYIHNVTIGECLFYKIENEEKRNNEFYSNIALKNNLNDNTIKSLCFSYYSYIDNWLEEMKLYPESAFKYNRLWWEKSEYSGNVFSDYQSRKQMVKDDSFEDLYKILSTLVIVIDSQLHTSSNLYMYPSLFLPYHHKLNFSKIPSQRIKRPYIKMVCDVYNAKLIANIKDDCLCVAYITIDDEELYFNDTFKKYFDVNNPVSVSKIFSPSAHRNMKRTHVSEIDISFDKDDMIGYIYDSNIRFIDNNENLTLLFVIHREWSCDCNPKISKYMFETIIEKLNIDVSDNESLYANEFDDESYIPNINNDISYAIYYKTENDFKYVKNKCQLFLDDEEYIGYDDLIEIYDQKYYWHIWDFIEILGLSYDNAIKYNKKWWTESEYSNNIFLSPYDRTDTVVNYYPLLYRKLNEYVITRTSQSHDITLIEPDDYRFKKVEKEFGDVCNDTIVYQMELPYVEITCTENQAKQLIKINDDYLYIGYLSFSQKKWYFNGKYQEEVNDDEPVQTTKLYLPCTGREICTDFIFYGKREYDEDNISERHRNSRLHIFDGSVDMAEVFVIYKDWDFIDHSDPTEYMLKKLIEKLECQ